MKVVYDLKNEMNVIVKSIRDGIEVATMHHVSRDMKVQIAALVLHDELTELSTNGGEGVMLLLKLAREVCEMALEVGQKCGGAK